MPRALVIFCCVLLFGGAGVTTGPWSEKVEVRRREVLAVTYRARLEGHHLVVEARHEPGWHTYAMDNVERARRASGQKRSETEMPTRIEIDDGLLPVGPWLQSPPDDLSQPELRWYTWGFSGTSHFAVAVERGQARRAVVRINGQACTESQCLWIDELVLEVPKGNVGAGEEAVDLAGLVTLEKGPAGVEVP